MGAFRRNECNSTKHTRYGGAYVTDMTEILSRWPGYVWHDDGVTVKAVIQNAPLHGWLRSAIASHPNVDYCQRPGPAPTVHSSSAPSFLDHTLSVHVGLTRSEHQHSLEQTEAVEPLLMHIIIMCATEHFFTTLKSFALLWFTRQPDVAAAVRHDRLSCQCNTRVFHTTSFLQRLLPLPGDFYK
jgi:hypothetical protein